MKHHNYKLSIPDRDVSFLVKSVVLTFLFPQILIMVSGTIEDGSNGDTADDHYHHYMVISFCFFFKMHIVSDKGESIG